MPPKSKTKSKAAKRASAPKAKRATGPVLDTLAKCEAELNANREDRKDYEKAKKVRDGLQPSHPDHAKAVAKMDSHRKGYNAYWRAYRYRKALRPAAPAEPKPPAEPAAATSTDAKDEPSS